MGVNALLDMPEIVGCLRLCNALHGACRNPLNRKQKFLTGLARLIRADHAISLLIQPARTNPLRIVSSIQTGRGRNVLTTLQQQILNHPSLSPVNGDGSVLFSRVPLRQFKVDAWLAFSRSSGMTDPFSQRDRTMVDLFHFETRWIYRFDLPLASPKSLGLSPRARQTLHLLLDHRDEKSIAALMNISPNTVHHYVKQLYQHFKVNNRREMLAVFN